MLSIPKYPEQYAQHFPTISYLLCCASKHHVMPVLTHGVGARTFYSPACCCLLLLLLLAKTCCSALAPKRWCKTSTG